MVFDVLALGGVIAVFWRARMLRGSYLDPARMPAADRPPQEARHRVPRTRLRRYVGEGLEDLEYFLSERDQAA